MYFVVNLNKGLKQMFELEIKSFSTSEFTIWLFAAEKQRIALSLQLGSPLRLEIISQLLLEQKMETVICKCNSD